MTLVDSNVLLDVMIAGQHWAIWSESQLETAARNGPLIINDIIYAEVSARFNEVEILDESLASKTFVRYRRAGGVRTGVLPDFFVGAHAAIANIPLLTRDRHRYRTYFPTVNLITPDETDA